MEQQPLPPELEDRFRALVAEVGLNDIWPALRALARPCWGVELVPGAAGNLVGTSRLGGLPDLPAGLSWPESEGQLLTFVGQVNLAEVPRLPVPLPEKGLLSFFLGIDEPASNIEHRVLFCDDPDDRLVCQEEPDEDAFLNEDCTGFKPAGVRFVPTVSLPFRFRDPRLDDLGDELEELRGKLGHVPSPRGRSQLLGHPLVVSGDPLAEAYVTVHGHPNLIYALHKTVANAERDLAEAEVEGDEERVETLRRQKDSLTWFQGARDHHRREIGHWQLLLEVNSHRTCGMSWWDAGRLQFHIDTRDLASRHFGRTYACVQSS